MQISPGDDDPSIGLAQRLRHATQAHHVRAERAGVMPDLLRGSLPLPVYCAMLRNLHAIYAALERSLTQHRNHSGLAPIWDPALARRDAIASDLESLGSPSDRAGGLTLAASSYVDHLDRAADTSPQLLAAHAYVRYLGDLSGGQVLSRVVARSYGLKAGEPGLRFYDFGGAPAVQALAQRFRRGLDEIRPTPVEARALVDEACDAFERHERLFDELAAVAA